MPRPLRIEYPGAIYHVMSRGNHGEKIFVDDQDRRRFLFALEQACQKTEWQVHAYCLMHNHFHLVLETPQPNLVAGMKWLMGVYTQRYNHRHKLQGHLFGGRYKALLVDGSGNGYLRTVCDYVHLNPIRANLLEGEAALETFLWSSYGAYLELPKERPAWLRVDRLFGEHGIPADSLAGRRQFAARMRERRAQETEADYRELRRGWYLGDEEFKQELIDAAIGRAGPSHAAERRMEAENEKAERIIREEVKGMGWGQNDLKREPKGAKQKVDIARRLRRETTLTLKDIAAHLEMGSWTYVSNLLRAAKNTK